MSNIVEYSTRQYPLCNEGVHQAVLVDVYDLGQVTTKFGPKRRVLFFWALEESDEKQHPLLVVQGFTRSLHPSSRLHAAISTILGNESGRRLDLDTLIGANAKLDISHFRTTDDRVLMHVDALSCVPASEPLLRVPEGFRRKQDRSPGEGPWLAGPVKLVREPRPAAPAATTRPAAGAHGLTSQDFVEARGGVSEPVETDSEQNSRAEISDKDIPF